MRLMKLLERRKIHEKETEGSKADACGDTVSVLYCGTFSVLYSFCGNQINGEDRKISLSMKALEDNSAEQTEE